MFAPVKRLYMMSICCAERIIKPYSPYTSRSQLSFVKASEDGGVVSVSGSQLSFVKASEDSGVVSVSHVVELGCCEF